jgi:lysozyme
VDREALKKRLVEEEGWRRIVYDDHLGHATVGVGLNLDESHAQTLLQWVGADYDAVRAGAALTDEQVDRLLDRCVTEAEEAARANVPRYAELPDAAQRVVVDMIFQMGWPRVRGFRKFLAALGRLDCAAAADEMLDSTWAKDQTPRRAEALAEIMRACARED